MSQGVVISLGSINADFQVRVDRQPDLSEGVLLAHDFVRLGGGKAANVAYLARRLGISTRLIGQETAQIGECIRVQVSSGAVIAIEKIAALYTSRDPAIACCIEASQQIVLAAASFTDLLNASKHAWERLWMRCDFEFEPAEGLLPVGEVNSPTQQVEYLRIARLHIFHILQTFSPHTADLDTGLPARGWHGEGYRGHIFWDEVFVLPFLIYRFPAIAREILLYRYRRLNAARNLAREQGYRGAMFPWRSASTGGEETPRFQLNLLSGHWLPDYTKLQRHISAIVAHTVWEYYIITDDIMFLCDYGAELLIEIARFWVSFATYNAECDCPRGTSVREASRREADRYEILGVMGPDEYHTAYPNANTPGINNNSYTNLMAVWTLCRAREVLDLLPASRYRELCHWLNLSQDEIDHWDTVSRKMRVVFYENGSLSQYEGFDRLKELDWQQFDHERINWVLEARGDDVNHYQVAKQADLAMLFFLFSKAEIEALLQRLGYTFDQNQMQQTLAYHLQRTSHESSLSRFIYAGALCQLDREKSWQLFTQSLITDVSGASSDEVKTGIHLGAMAGTLYVLQHHYLGLKVNRGRIYLNPSFPTSINRLRVSFQLQSNDFQIEKIGDRLNVTAASTNQSSISIIYQGEAVDLQPGISQSFALTHIQHPQLSQGWLGLTEVDNCW